jgi:hypothetical protein
MGVRKYETFATANDGTDRAGQGKRQEITSIFLHPSLQCCSMRGRVGAGSPDPAQRVMAPSAALETSRAYLLRATPGNGRSYGS